jgi:histidinol dehydrogenase
MRILSSGIAVRRVSELASRGTRLEVVEPEVRKIIAAVRRGGDRALRRYAERWDGLGRKQSLRVDAAEIEAAWGAVTPELRQALGRAAGRIRSFARRQKPKEWRRSRGGISLGQLVRPLDSVGCYVPGGRHPLVSTVLMTVIPAQVAGVKQIRVVSPRPSLEVLAAAALLGIKEFYRVGGAQAIAGLAYGSESVARVDKIVGPGNLYVTAAKKLVAFDCAIDFLAGPTEVVIVAERERPDFIAADLVAQAEHDPEALAVLVTTSRELAKSVHSWVEKLAHGNKVARQSLDRRGAILVAESRTVALEWANRLAPEHMTVARREIPQVHNAGSVFVGDYSAQAAGDYASGPNHVLPTGGVARYRGGLSVMDFLKLISVQEVSPAGLREIASLVESLAETEGLEAHAASIRIRRAHA